MPIVIFELQDRTERTIDAPADWTLMEIARGNDIAGVIAECGGGAICGTCHVILDPESFARLPPAEVVEQSLLEVVPQREPTSRLSCQVVVTSEVDGLRARVPSEQLAM